MYEYLAKVGKNMSFATKKDLLAWCDDYLEPSKIKGRFVDPINKVEMVLVKRGRFWALEGVSDEWYWKREDFKG